jgi:hypothetical protein
MVESMTEDRLDELLAEIRRRIQAEDSARRRRNRVAVTLGGAAACVVVTGGTLAVAQATNTEKSVSICFQAASAQSEAAEVGTAPMDGVVGDLPDMATRVAFAEAQCEAVWQVGLLGEGSSPAGSVPDLFTCLLADGRLGVFPVASAVDCEVLGLPEP